jgi:hypothetical protein
MFQGFCCRHCVRFRWAAEASGLVRVAMFMGIGGGSQGETSGCIVSSIMSFGWSKLRRPCSVHRKREGGRLAVCQAKSYAWGSVNIERKWLGIGNDSRHRLTTGWDVGRESRRRAYLRCLWSRRIETGGRAASLCSARIGVEFKAFRIRGRAAFCYRCSSCSRFFCQFHHISALKLDLEVTHAW